MNVICIPLSLEGASLPRTQCRNVHGHTTPRGQLWAMERIEKLEGILFIRTERRMRSELAIVAQVIYIFRPWRYC